MGEQKTKHATGWLFTYQPTIIPVGDANLDTLSLLGQPTSKSQTCGLIMAAGAQPWLFY